MCCLITRSRRSSVTRADPPPQSGCDHPLPARECESGKNVVRSIMRTVSVASLAAHHQVIAALKSSTYARYLELVVREFGPP